MVLGILSFFKHTSVNISIFQKYQIERLIIKELIKDISYDKISLDQALTRAKLITYKIDNGEFISWLNHELNGYYDSSPVPEYQKFYCDILAKVENPYYGSRITPIDLTEINKQVDINLYSYIHRSGILNIEKNLIEAQKENEQYGYIDFPIDIVKNVRDIFQNNDISAVRKRIQFGNLNNILNVAKQKLLDTLLELNKAFPNLEDEYMNDDKKDTASQIITNIYGNNASSNVGVGRNFTQGISNSYTEKVEQVLNDLRQLGVLNEDINELENIINSEPDKSKLGTKFLAWSSAFMTKAVKKGIDVKVPEFLDAIQNLII